MLIFINYCNILNGVEKKSDKPMSSILIALALSSKNPVDVTIPCDKCIVTTFAGSGRFGNKDATGIVASFNSPEGISLDSSENIFVGDFYNHKIRKITSAGDVTTFAGSGTPGSSDGVGTAASFNSIDSVVVDNFGNVYATDFNNNKIRKINSSGIVSTFAGTGNVGSKDGIASTASFNGPIGLAVDSYGDVYVSDYSNHKIRKITSLGVVTTVAGSGILGSNDGIGTAASFNYPHGLAIDNSGNVIVADEYNHKIRKITPSGVVTTLAGSGKSGSNDTTGTGASFYFPAAVAVDNAGNVYVGDSFNYKIRKITSLGFVTTIAGSGQWGDIDGAGISARFSFPNGIAADKYGNIFVADTANCKIRKIIQ
jgi:sugar lactone lactonase YvrE